MENNKQQSQDEIDLFELALIIWKRKFYIITAVFLISVSAVVYSLSLDNIYESRAVLKPTDIGGSSSVGNLGGLGTLASFAGVNVNSGGSFFADASILVQDRRFIADLIKKNKFEPKLFEDQSVLTTDEFKLNETINLYNSVKDLLSFTEDKSTKYITLAFRHEDPAFAKEFVNVFLKEISAALKEKHMKNTDQRIENYKLEIDRAYDVTIKNKLSELVVNLIQSKVLANADEYYGFSIISEAYQSDINDRVAPSRSKICIIAAFGGLILSVFAALAYDVLGNNIRSYRKNMQAQTE